MTEFNLREALDAEYQRGYDEGRSCALLEEAAKIQKLSDARAKKEAKQAHKKLIEALLPLMDIMGVYLEDDPYWND